MYTTEGEGKRDRDMGSPPRQAGNYMYTVVCGVLNLYIIRLWGSQFIHYINNYV